MRNLLSFMTAPRIAVAVLIVVAIAHAPSFAEPYWFERYQKAIELIDDGAADQAAPILEELIASRPEPLVSVRLPGHLYIDYLPYYQQARARLQQGNVEGAARSLEVALSHGQVTATQRHLRGLAELRQGLADARMIRAAQTPMVSALR